jgi:cobalamin biosynthesis protein CobD/CbiB
LQTVATVESDPAGRPVNVVATTVESTQDELTRRHAAAARFVGGMIVFTLLLVAAAVSGVLGNALNFNPMLANILRISIIFLAGGAFVFRRTKFTAMRLRDIAALRGATGLLDTLQRTTVSVAVIGGVIAVFGFVVSLMTANPWEAILLGGVAVVVLLYSYPRRDAWQSVVAALADDGNMGTDGIAKGTIS